ncbi:MAG: hypothetical protein RL341_340, partial [Pseudomonadota bacterium]
IKQRRFAQLRLQRKFAPPHHPGRARDAREHNDRKYEYEIHGKKRSKNTALLCRVRAATALPGCAAYPLKVMARVAKMHAAVRL